VRRDASLTRHKKSGCHLGLVSVRTGGNAMKSGSFLAIGVVMMAGLSQASAQAPAPPQVDPNAPVYTVGYLDIANSSKNAALPLLKQFVNLCRKEEGVLRCEVAQRLEQPNQFVTLGAWKDKKSFDAH